MESGIVYCIATFSTSLREIVQFAGTCKKVRELILKHPWDVEFATKDINVAMEMLARYKTCKINLSGMKDSQVLRKLGKDIAEMSGNIQLRTNSFFLMDGLNEARSEQSGTANAAYTVFDKLEFDIIIDLNEAAASNVRKKDMFLGWKEIVFRRTNLIDAETDEHYDVERGIVANAVYAARDCNNITFCDMTPETPFVIDKMIIADYTAGETDACCKTLELRNSQVCVIEENIFGMCENVYIDENSILILTDKPELILPNAHISHPERVRIIRQDKYDGYNMLDPNIIGYTGGYLNQYYADDSGADNIHGRRPVNMVEGESVEL